MRLRDIRESDPEAFESVVEALVADCPDEFVRRPEGLFCRTAAALLKWSGGEWVEVSGYDDKTVWDRD